MNINRFVESVGGHEQNRFVGITAHAGNSTFAIGGISCSAESLVVAESFVLRINICGENRHLRQAANPLAGINTINHQRNI